MAAVYEATDPLDRRWAIKVLSDVLLPQREIVDRFQREARVVLSLRHPHIVQLHNFEPHEDLHFLVLEFVQGRSLRMLLDEERRVSMGTALRWFRQLASALDYAHAQGVVHRDIKPDNILIRESGDAVITDFGIAKVVGGTTALTQTGHAMGTAYYMSPEQWTGDDLGGAADQYSLGVVLFEALGGEKPFGGDTLQTIMLAHLTKPPRDLAALRDDVPAGMVQVLARMLAKDPRERFATVGDAAEAAPEQLTPGGPGMDDLSATDVVRGDGPPRPRPPAGKAKPRPVAIEDQAAAASGVRGETDDPPPGGAPAEGSLLQRALRSAGKALKRGGEGLGALIPRGGSTFGSPRNVRLGAGLGGIGLVLVGSAVFGYRWLTVPDLVELRFAQGDTLVISEEGAEAVVRVVGLAESGGSLPVHVSTWVSGDPQVAQVEAIGPDSARIIAMGEGTTGIRAASEGRATNLTVLVQPETAAFSPLAELRFPAGDTLELGARSQGALVRVAGVSASGGPAAVEELEWSSDDPEVARVEPAGPEAGRIMVVGEGSTVVRASAGELSAGLFVRIVPASGVQPPRIGSFHFDPPGELRLEIGEGRVVRVDALGPGDVTVSEERLDWSVTDEGTARLAATGERSATLEGVAAGETFLRVASGGVRDSVRVLVRAEEVASVSVSPRRLDLLPDETLGLSVALRGTRSPELSRPVEWISRNPAVARVDQDGRVRAAAPGATYLIARAGGRTDSVPVAVGPAPEPGDASIGLRVEGGRLLLSASFDMTVRTEQTFCLRGGVRVEEGPWVPTSDADATLSPQSASARADLAVSFDALELPSRGNVERRATPRLTLWSGPCDVPPVEGPLHTLLGDEVCLVRFAARDWTAEACNQ